MAMFYIQAFTYGEATDHGEKELSAAYRWVAASVPAYRQATLGEAESCRRSFHAATYLARECTASSGETGSPDMDAHPQRSNSHALG